MSLAAVNLSGSVFDLAGRTLQNFDLSNVIARNSTAFGLDTRSLAADIGELGQIERALFFAQLSPVEQGNLMRMFDEQSGAGAAAPDTKTKTEPAVLSSTMDGLSLSKDQYLESARQLWAQLNGDSGGI
jgi:hypothetical protein